MLIKRMKVSLGVFFINSAASYSLAAAQCADVPLFLTELLSSDTASRPGRYCSMSTGSIGFFDTPGECADAAKDSDICAGYEISYIADGRGYYSNQNCFCCTNGPEENCPEEDTLYPEEDGWNVYQYAVPEEQPQCCLEPPSLSPTTTSSPTACVEVPFFLTELLSSDTASRPGRYCEKSTNSIGFFDTPGECATAAANRSDICVGYEISYIADGGGYYSNQNCFCCTNDSEENCPEEDALYPEALAWNVFQYAIPEEQPLCCAKSTPSPTVSSMPTSEQGFLCGIFGSFLDSIADFLDSLGLSFLDGFIGSLESLC